MLGAGSGCRWQIAASTVPVPIVTARPYITGAGGWNKRVLSGVTEETGADVVVSLAGVCRWRKRRTLHSTANIAVDGEMACKKQGLNPIGKDELAGQHLNRLADIGERTR